MRTNEVILEIMNETAIADFGLKAQRVIRCKNDDGFEFIDAADLPHGGGRRQQSQQAHDERDFFPAKRQIFLPEDRGHICQSLLNKRLPEGRKSSKNQAKYPTVAPINR